jgi:hypothetical protein
MAGLSARVIIAAAIILTLVIGLALVLTGDHSADVARSSWGIVASATRSSWG